MLEFLFARPLRKSDITTTCGTADDPAPARNWPSRSWTAITRRPTRRRITGRAGPSSASRTSTPSSIASPYSRRSTPAAWLPIARSIASASARPSTAPADTGRRSRPWGQPIGPTRVHRRSWPSWPWPITSSGSGSRPRPTSLACGRSSPSLAGPRTLRPSTSCTRPQALIRAQAATIER